MAGKVYKVAVFEAGNFNDPNKGIEAVYAKDGRQAISKVRSRVNQECGSKFGPKLSFRVIEDDAEVTK